MIKWVEPQDLFVASDVERLFEKTAKITGKKTKITVARYMT